MRVVDPVPQKLVVPLIPVGAVGEVTGITAIVFVELVEPQAKLLEQEILPEFEPTVIVCVGPPDPPVQLDGKDHDSVPLPTEAVY